MSRILITGGAGFIGYFLAARLSGDEANNVTIVDNFTRGKRDEDLRKLMDRKNVKFLQGDLTEAAFLSRLPGDFDYIYHLAAVIGVRNIVKSPDYALRVNALSTLNMFEYAKSAKGLKGLFFASTSEVYSGTLRHLPIVIPTPETVPIALDDISADRTVYAVSKIYGESAAFVYGRKYGIPITIGRFHNIYGPRMGFDHVIPEMFQKISRHATVEVASPSHTRAFCYVDDAVEFMVRACENKASMGGVLHIGNPREEINMRDLVIKIARIMNKNITVKALPDTAGSPRRRCPDTSKIERLTGYRAGISLEDGIKRSYMWYRDRLNANTPEASTDCKRSC